MTPPYAIGFVGGGQMATALAAGWAAAGLLDLARSAGTALRPASRAKFTDAAGVRTVATNAGVAAAADVLILAVKPQTVPALLAELRPLLQPRHLVVSVAAGVTLAQLADGLGTAVRVVRVMPNTPCLVGASASGYAAGPAATHDDADLVARLFGAAGVAVPVPEHLLNAVTGLSGSGPAYGYVMIEALADGGVRAGLPRDVAVTLAAQTLLGAAKMVLETKRHPGALKDAVASPGGTTIAGLYALERGGLRATLMDAVAASAKRAEELTTETQRTQR